MTNDPWHFKRRTLTGRVLEVLTRGPVQALSLFAPRRAGKTEFLIRDLPPRAESLGHRGGLRLSSERKRLPRHACRRRFGGSNGSGSRTRREANGSWPILGSGCGFGVVGAEKRRLRWPCRRSLVTRMSSRVFVKARLP